MRMRTLLLAAVLLPALAHAEIIGFSQRPGLASGSSDGLYSGAGAAASSGIPIPYGATVSNLYCVATAGPDNGGGTETWTVTVTQATASDYTLFNSTTLTCPISDTATTCNDTNAGHNVSFSQNDRINIHLAVTAGTPITTPVISCTVRVL